MADNSDQTPSNRAKRSAETRNALLDATVVLLLSKGYEACSLANIAKAAGMTTGPVQHHFKTKAELMMTVIEERIFNVDPNEYIVSDAEHNLPLHDRCEIIVERLWRYYGRPRYLGLWGILLGMDSDPEMKARVNEWAGNLSTIFEVGVTRLFHDHSMSPAKVDALCSFLTTQMRGLSMMPTLFGTEEGLEKQLELVARILEVMVISNEF